MQRKTCKEKVIKISFEIRHNGKVMIWKEIFVKVVFTYLKRSFIFDWGGTLVPSCNCVVKHNAGKPIFTLLNDNYYLSTITSYYMSKINYTFILKTYTCIIIQVAWTRGKSVSLWLCKWNCYKKNAL